MTLGLDSTFRSIYKRLGSHTISIGVNKMPEYKNAHDLMQYVIKPKQWKDLYEKMPPECQELVDGERGALPIEIGRNDELGWFMLYTGYGPLLFWAESLVEQNA